LERAILNSQLRLPGRAALVMYPILRSAARTEKSIAAAAQQGKKIGCFGLTEPQFG